MLSLIFSLTLSTASAATFTPPIEKRVQQVVSVFENSTEDIQYDYIENIGDGRGYTAGESGFTTGTGDLVLVAQDYVNHKPSAAWTRLLPLLNQLAASGSGSVKGLEALPRLWVQSAKDPEFIKSQDSITDQLYKAPARRELDKYGFSSPLAYLIFYDTMIQHGDGDDPDSFSGVVKKMRDLPKTESKFLTEFLHARETVLLNPADQDSAEAWRESVDRVHALQRLVDQEVCALQPPFDVHVWDTDYEFQN